MSCRCLVVILLAPIAASFGLSGDLGRGSFWSSHSHESLKSRALERFTALPVELPKDSPFLQRTGEANAAVVSACDRGKSKHVTPILYIEAQLQATTLVEALKSAFSIAAEKGEAEPLEEGAAEQLVAIGAVWTMNATSPATKSSGNRKWRRVRLTDKMLPAHTMARVYQQPRRFLGCYVDDWAQRLLHLDAAFVVIDKPAMLPCQPDNSNSAECVPACALGGLRKVLLSTNNRQRRPRKHDSLHHLTEGDDTATPLPPLLLVHRLDTCTEGCYVLARNAKAQAQFNRWLKQHKVDKEYLCLSEVPVSQGIKRHHMLHGDFASYNRVFGPGPRLLRRTPPPPPRSPTLPEGLATTTAAKNNNTWMEWKECVLEVVSSRKVQCGELVLGEVWDSIGSANEQRPLPPKRFLYESRVKLRTGRTHQIRAQFAAMGAPLLFDSLYQPMTSIILDDEITDLDVFDETQGSSGVGGNCTVESFGAARRRGEFVVPAWPIGLQAARISFAGRDVQCRDPWWRRRNHAAAAGGS